MIQVIIILAVTFISLIVIGLFILFKGPVNKDDNLSHQDKLKGKSINPELLAMIKGIHFKTNHLVNDIMAGEYTSAFKGRGMEFEEVREYQPGDDVRCIDWNVTARMGSPFIKEYREERELTVMLIVDVSSSGFFGSENRLKNEVAAEIAAILAFAAVKSNDKVGLILFTDRVEKYIPPKKGRGHVWRVIKEVLQFNPVHTRTDLSLALDYLGKVLRRRSVCFLISDFLAEGYEKNLRLASRRHDVIAVKIDDPRERELPNVGQIELEDAESGEVVLVDTADARVRKEFSKHSANERKVQKNLLKEIEIEQIEISTSGSCVEPLRRFFMTR